MTSKTPLPDPLPKGEEKNWSLAYLVVLGALAIEIGLLLFMSLKLT